MIRSRITALAFFVLGMLTMAAAAYAPHNSTMRNLARKTAYVAPCSSTIAWDSKPQQVAAYPVPGEDVIARGHSGRN